MTTIQNYILEVIAFMAVLYLFYLLFLSRDTFYSRNRAYLIASILTSLILPALSFNIGGGLLAGFQSELSQIVPIGTVTVTSGAESTGSISINPMLAIYIGGAFISLSLTGISLIKLFKMVKSGRITGTRIVMTNEKGVSGFSAFGYIFLSEKLSKEELERITEHETKHIDNKHFYDLLFIKIIGIIFWFNPLIYMYERSLKAVHEYQADQKVISGGENILEYQRLLLNQLFRTNIFSVQNAFAGTSLIKKRIIMMTKQKTRNRAVLKLLLIVPVLAILAVMFSCSKDDTEVVVDKEVKSELVAIEDGNKDQDMTKIEEDTKDNREVFVVVEDMPTFEGGDLNHFRDWVQKRVTYPKIAIDNGIQGKVFIMFVVNPDGTVSDVDIMRGVDPSLDNEAAEVVKSSPSWVAGKQKGVEVPVRFSITVNFQLQ